MPRTTSVRKTVTTTTTTTVEKASTVAKIKKKPSKVSEGPEKIGKGKKMMETLLKKPKKELVKKESSVKVWITGSGSCYHSTAECSCLTKTVKLQKVSLNEAQMGKMVPCSVCCDLSLVWFFSFNVLTGLISAKQLLCIICLQARIASCIRTKSVLIYYLPMRSRRRTPTIKSQTDENFVASVTILPSKQRIPLGIIYC